MTALGTIMDAIASQLSTTLCGTADPLIEDLQVDGRLVFNPTPPVIDVYPADPHQTALGFGDANNEMAFTVRARVSTAEHEGGQDLLLEMMDNTSTTSVAKALLADRTLTNQVSNLRVEGPSGFGVFPDPALTSGSLLGCTWTVRVIP